MTKCVKKWLSQGKLEERKLKLADMRTSLGGAKVFAGSRSARTGTAGLLDAERAAVDGLALETVLGSVGLVGCDHFDETEATRLLAVGVAHDLALLDLAVLLEHARHLGLGQTGVDTGHEEVRAGVNCTVIIDIAGARATVVLGSARKKSVLDRLFSRDKCDIEIKKAMNRTCRRQRREKRNGEERSPGPHHDAAKRCAGRRARSGHRHLGGC